MALKIYRVTAREIPGYIEVEAKDEHDAMIKASMSGISVKSIFSLGDAPENGEKKEKGSDSGSGEKK